METFLEKLLRVFPAYFDDLLRLITGPKRFIAECLSTNRLELRDALVFLGVSCLLDEAPSLPLDKGDLLSALNSTVHNFIAAIAFGLCLFLSWRCVGGAAELRKFPFNKFLLRRRQRIHRVAHYVNSFGYGEGSLP
jgi:hypothetical protein